MVMEFSYSAPFEGNLIRFWVLLAGGSGKPSRRQTENGKVYSS
jgi:hypothetical protein